MNMQDNKESNVCFYKFSSNSNWHSNTSGVNRTLRLKPKTLGKQLN